MPARERGRGPVIQDHQRKTTSPVIKLVHSTVYDALKASVSDIHLETHAGRPEHPLPHRRGADHGRIAGGLETGEQVISRIKIMSELDIAERRVPQDGRFKVSVHGHEVDFRVSIMPSIFGEDAVLRISTSKPCPTRSRGCASTISALTSTTLTQLRRLASEAYGMLLVTGPTGSGKTTTLYAADHRDQSRPGQDRHHRDPVEYQLPGVLQIPVNEKKGLSFAPRPAFHLRHDPDKIMVGEIRDPETAQIAVQSALTGHLVFTTVHANNVFDVIGRFIHMGRRSLQFRLRHERHHGATPGAGELPALRRRGSARRPPAWRIPALHPNRRPA